MVNSLNELAGNIHIHTRYSDGSGDIPTIAGAAEKAGLDFIIITDHHHLQGKAEEGYYGKVMVLVGSEINEECNHYLALDIEQPVPGNDHHPQEVIDMVNNQGGFGFIAHGIEKGSLLYRNGKTYPWNDWRATGFTGIDIWSYLSQWRDEITGIPKGFFLYFNPHYAFKKGPMKPLLRKWDELLRKRMVVGIGCSDAHAIKLKLGPWRPVLSDYYLCFRCINTHLFVKEPLSGDFEKDKAQIYQALKSGRCFVGYDFFRKTTGFNFVAKDQGKTALMGEKIRLTEKTVLEVEVPEAAKIFLIKDGRKFRETMGKRSRFSWLGKGVYRVEAYLPHGRGHRAWIFSNPIFLE